ncbi:MAG: ABC transporter substrate-binding protein [Betaproteobacteria bacterium]|nr:ABC transporter substrate-binding protein [Betaproteobacteria bacterium]
MDESRQKRRLRQKARERYLVWREALATYWPFLVLVLAGFLLAFHFVKPAPPKKLVMSTGREDGLYHAFAKQYQEYFAKNGVTLELKTSQGSGENFRRLRDQEADIAFVQGGSASNRQNSGGVPEYLLSLGSAFYEPLWVFVSGSRMPKKLSELAGRKITIIQESTSSRALANRLLAANELGEQDVQLMPMDEMEAAMALQRGQLDALFVIAAPEAPVVQVLLRSPTVRLMSFTQAEAYHRRFPYLFRITMPEGVIDLVRDYPPQDTELLAATANLVVREELHTALQTLMLAAMREIHGGSGFFQVRGEFPAYKDSDFQLSPAAERFYASGPPFMQRYMPFWVAVLMERFLILAIPLLTLLLPLVRFAPALYHWRIHARLCRVYGELKFLEQDLSRSPNEEARRELVKRLNIIEETANRMPIPLRFTDMLYTLKAHINLVRKRAERGGEDKTAEEKNDE